MKPIRYLAAARLEYESQIQYLIQNRSIERALAFKAEIEKAESAIQKKPDGYQFSAGCRSYGPTRKEKYRVIYDETETEIIIVAVYFSGVADPLYWVGR